MSNNQTVGTTVDSVELSDTHTRSEKESFETELEGESTESEKPTTSDLSLDIVFDIAKNERRRLVLRYLRDHEGPVQLGELAEHIAALENDKEVRMLTSEERKRVYVGLYQCHLPKMDGAGVVNFDRNPGITLGPNADQVMMYVETPDDSQVEWNRYYLMLSGTGILVLLFSAFASLGIIGTLLTGGVMAALLGTAIVHTVTDRE